VYKNQKQIKKNMKFSYNQTPEEIGSTLSSDLSSGLTSQLAQERLTQFGKNKITAQRQDSLFKTFIQQCADPLTYLLISAAFLIFFIGQTTDAAIIVGILLCNAIIGTLQEKRAHRLLQTLETMLISEAVVIRDGKKQILEHTLLVPGDLLIISAGERIPADARIVYSNNFSVDESILTGESETIGKRARALEGQNIPVYEQNNMIFQGTYVLTGYAHALVTATGNHTEVGKIHKNLNTIDTSAPLQKELELLSNFILQLTFIICASLFIIGLWSGKTITELIIMLTALLICIVPEGLPLIMTLVLVTGAYRMSKKNILVKHLKAIEGLGRADIIIIDKTGTLTKNEMMVSHVFTAGHSATVSGNGYTTQGEIHSAPDQMPFLHEMGIASILLNDTHIEHDATQNIYKVKGDPTQASALIFAKKLGLDEQTVQAAHKIHHLIPFDSSYRFKAVFFSTENTKCKAYIMGSPDVIFNHCYGDLTQAHEALQQFVQKGLRAIAFASMDYHYNPEHTQDYKKLISHNLTFLGLIGIQDTIKEDISDLVNIVKKNGIKIVMATGDHKSTAQHIAKQVGIYEPGDKMISGSEFAQMNDKRFLSMFKQISICARFTPEDKLRLIEVLKKDGHIVIMTGDGINDVPSLVAADVSITMNSIGTELAKESADIILLKDSFAHIVDGIILGKNIFYALRRTILYFLTSNAAEVFIVLIGLLVFKEVPLAAAHILWMNVLTDGLLDVSLAMEPAQTKQLTHYKTTPKHIIDLSMVVSMLVKSIPMALACVGIFAWYKPYGLMFAQTMTLLTLVFFQWFNALNCRSTKKSIFTLGVFSNPWLSAACGFVLGLQIIMIYAPFMNTVFKTTPLSLEHWIVACTVGSSIFIIHEAYKRIMYYQG
jgi:Ca2+-transporting ATPase